MVAVEPARVLVYCNASMACGEGYMVGVERRGC